MRLLLILLAALVATPAVAREQTVFTLAIGFNGLPPSADQATLRPLRFADDDAARVYTLARQTGGWARLLTLIDLETAERFPELTGESVPPTRAELRRAVADL